MERTIKIEFDPQRSYAVESGDGHVVGLMTDAMLTAELAAVSKIFVSPSGSDSYDGLTELTPVKSMAKGIELAVSNSRAAVVLMPGDHYYLASHNLYGKRLIGMSGVRLLDIGTTTAGNIGLTSYKWSFDAREMYNASISPALSGFQPDYCGTGVWFTGRSDIPTDAGKANRYYLPAVSDGGALRLCRLRMHYNAQPVPIDPLENEWQVSDAIGDMEVYFGSEGYPSIAFPSPVSLDEVLVASPENSVFAHTDGAGRVFVVLRTKCDLAGGSDFREVVTIWYNGAIQYWYELPLSPSEADYGPQCYGNATTAGPMIRQYGMFGGGGYQRHTAIQPKKRIGASGYQYSVQDTFVDNIFDRVRARVPAFYFDGVPMFSDFQGTGKCYSAQQFSDALQSAAGVFANLPAWASAIITSAQRTLAVAHGYGRGGPYNRFGAFIDYAQNTNPNTPFLTAPAMTSTDAAASALDPVYFASAEAVADNLFYGGSVVNINYFAQLPVGKARIAPYNTQDIPLAVHGLGVNTRLQNCQIIGTDIGAQVRSYTEQAQVNAQAFYRQAQDRAFIEAWNPTGTLSTDQDAEGTVFSNFILGADFNWYCSSAKPTGAVRIRNSAFAGIYLVAERAELWHVSATSCAYACTNDEHIFGSCFSYFTGYYLTPDASPVVLDYCFVRESLAQNLIPPGSTVTNTQSTDPLFRSVVNPYDLRLQATSKDDFFDSPALAATPTVSVFGGNREAGAYDERGIVEITWRSFEIVFPWLMPIETDRFRVSNRRRDGVRTKYSTSKASVGLRMQWRVALSETDLRNIERLVNADECMIRVYFNPVSKPTTYLTGYVDQSMRHGGPMALLSNVSENVSLDFDLQQPGESLFDWI